MMVTHGQVHLPKQSFPVKRSFLNEDLIDAPKMKWQRIIDDDDESDPKTNSTLELALSDLIPSKSNLHKPLWKSIQALEQVAMGCYFLV